MGWQESASKLFLIQKLDRDYASKVPTEFYLKTGDGEVKGIYVHADTADQMYLAIRPGEHVPTLKELMKLRTMAFFGELPDPPWAHTGPDIENVFLSIGRMEFGKDWYSRLIPTALESFGKDDNGRGIWNTRLTSSTNMVRIRDEGADEICFYDGFPDSFESIAESIRNGRISDGAFRYGDETLHRVKAETPQGRRMPWEEYKSARGGQFSGVDWLKHPVFSAAVGDPGVMADYILAMSALRNANQVRRPHSGWCPREMEHGYGRPIALGFGADAFYPPNNTTVGHSALVLPKKYTAVI